MLAKSQKTGTDTQSVPTKSPKLSAAAQPVLTKSPNISTDAQSMLKENPKIYLAVLIAQAVQDSKCTNPKLAHAYTSIVRHQSKN